MEELTVIHCSQAYRFIGELLGKNRNTSMYKTIDGKFIIFEKWKDDEGSISTYNTEAGLIDDGEPQWILWAGLDLPEDKVTRL
ncbi:hypothetical protein M3929_000001 [Vibrio metschnikovii]|nr:hypothetical protein [Vibrio metschnikovii]EKO3793749.1 hypothetical protein [Vibrio metschnikovii]ELY5191260.1 hypothetical protein [Vibrio cholerae]ELY5193457.1 hypothetical protein [Vibrio cholerae]